MAEDKVQRRLAAIVVADIVGYSRLMEADEEGTLAALKALRSEHFDPKVAEHTHRTMWSMFMAWPLSFRWIERGPVRSRAFP